MATRKITPSDQPAPVTRKKAIELCAEWTTADEQRLTHDADARALKKRQGEIEVELTPFVEGKKAGEERTVTIPNCWRMEINDEPPHANAIAFAALKELRELKGQKHIDQIARRLGTKPKLVIDDLRPATKKKAG